MRLLGCMIGLIVVSGCTYDAFDPYKRPGTWVPEGSNVENLRVQVANPHDLVSGAGQETSSGAEAAPPVARVLAGKRYPLPALNAAEGVDIVNQQPPTGATNPGSATAAQ
ncbi:MAG TPA: hypothetical protein VFL55_22065 [Acetobacteraceae bacterium]|jgi:hypothetical protein|nr:hypothetical protein [Acetobacteraceae bacterium]